MLEFEQWVFDLLAENQRAARIYAEESLLALLRQPQFITADAVKGINGTAATDAKATPVLITPVPLATEVKLPGLAGPVAAAAPPSAAAAAPAPATLPSGLPNVRPQDYLGRWGQHPDDLYSWRALSGSNAFTVETLSAFLVSAPLVGREFFSMQIWKKGGYIGDETPENFKCKAMYDENEAMMRCLFPEQDARCFDPAWIK